MDKKVLTVYYSHSGNTKNAAKTIAALTGSGLCELETAVPYPAEYKALVTQALSEIKSGNYPELVPMQVNPEDYDVLIVGSPNWCGTVAPAVSSFLSSCDLSGKTIYPFCTHGGSGCANMERDIIRLCPNAKVKSGYAFGKEADQTEALKIWLGM